MLSGNYISSITDFRPSTAFLASYSWLRVTQSKRHAPDFERISVQPYQITSKCKFHVNAGRYTHDSKYLKKLLEILLQDSQSRSYIKWEGRSRSVQVKAVGSAALPTYRPSSAIINSPLWRKYVLEHENSRSRVQFAYDMCHWTGTIIRMKNIKSGVIYNVQQFY